jgi:hypothetical protein
MIILQLVRIIPRIFIAFLLLFAVVVVFASPAVDLAPTALRGSRHAQALMLALVTVIHTVAGHLREAGFVAAMFIPLLLPHSGKEHVDLNCSRLC